MKFLLYNDPVTDPGYRRRRGRPATGVPAARIQILEALIGMLEAAPLARPSQRGIADAARVSPAVLQYHFRDLPGLMRCLLEERALPLLQPLLQELRSHAPSPAGALARFLQKWTALTLRHRWLPACVLQAPPGDDTLRDCGASLRAAVAAAQHDGAVRPDLPDSYLALLLLSLGLMPHLAQTALGAGLDTRQLAEPENAAALTLQHLAVLRDGSARMREGRARVA